MSAPARPTLVDYVTTYRKDTQMTTNKNVGDLFIVRSIEWSKFVDIIKLKEH